MRSAPARLTVAEKRRNAIRDQAAVASSSHAEEAHRGRDDEEHYDDELPAQDDQEEPPPDEDEETEPAPRYEGPSKRRKYDHDTGTIVELVNTAVSNALALQAAAQAANDNLDSGIASALMPQQSSRMELVVGHTMRSQGTGKGQEIMNTDVNVNMRLSMLKRIHDSIRRAKDACNQLIEVANVLGRNAASEKRKFENAAEEIAEVCNEAAREGQQARPFERY